MATACIPIREIKEKGTRGTQLFEGRRKSILARIRMFLLFPRALKFIIDNLSSGEKLGMLDQSQASSLYRNLMPLYDELAPWVKEFPSAPLAVRVLFGWWCRQLARETERLSDILETLAWGSQNELREHIDAAIEEIESPV